ncbi:serine/threonine-protein kinase [Paenibacillus sinopodophylli]|uniref:serine/threonine-protein kinase n=1 Tax=Paenibacillus sinopodophylli TaxID=1837342 RepID=UPI00148698A9|nr:serine/threonine-protein kinase [Paenibacillus sinopodophylli]
MGAANDQFDPYEPGMVLDCRYRIVGTLGIGGMGIVYAAEDLRLANKRRAIKVIAPQPGTGTFADEAKLLMTVNHPNLPVILDYYPASEDSFETFVMAYIEGQTISDYYRSSRFGMTFEQMMHVAKQLCAALRYLHANEPPIIHRDLKPSNVMIDADAQVKLIDFGISRHYKPHVVQDTALLGTYGFAAPEQAGGGQSDERTDIYGLGALLYYMSSGGLIYKQPQEHMNQDEPFQSMSKDIPTSFKSVLRRLLQSDPRMRYRTMQDVEEALVPYMNRSHSPYEWTLGSELDSFRTHKPITVCVLSISPGAGSTFLTHCFANLLSSNGISVAAAEYEHARPEWHAWLNGIRGMKDGLGIVTKALDRRYYQYSQMQPQVNWFALHNEQDMEAEQVDVRFDQMLQHSRTSLHLIDLSQKWKEPQAQRLMQGARFVIAVGDPVVAKWRASDLKRLSELNAELRAAGSELLYLANKEVAFTGRREWLALFPAEPLAVVPRLSDATLLSLQWKGRWATDDKQIARTVRKAAAPILKLLCNEMNTG